MPGVRRRALKFFALCLLLAASQPPLARSAEEDYEEEPAEDRGQYVDYSRRNKVAVGSRRDPAPRPDDGDADDADHWARFHPEFRRVAPGDAGSFCHRGNYRSLSPTLQGEHQCALLESIQNDGHGSRREQGERHLQLVSLVNAVSGSVEKLRKDMAHMSAACSSRSPVRPVMAASVEPPRTIPYVSNQSNFAASRDLPVKANCYQLQRAGITVSGVYPIMVGSKVVLVQCDMHTNGGGWTVIHHRNASEVSFNRKWADYSRGFGNPNSDYWLGNEHIGQMTSEDDFELRVDVWDWSRGTAHATYSYFRLGDVSSLFALRLGNFTGGDAGDALGIHHRDAPFSTPDSDNDRDRSQNCAALENSGWWFNACSYANLNGPYVQGGRVALGAGGVVSRGILWQTWKNDFGESMKRARMAIRPTTGRRAFYEGRRP